MSIWPRVVSSAGAILIHGRVRSTRQHRLRVDLIGFPDDYTEGKQGQMARRAKHTEAFQRDAVLAMGARGTKSVKALAEELGVSEKQLYNWKSRLNRGATPAAVPTTTERSDVEALRRRVRELEKDNAILKKAAAFFAKETL